MTSRYLVLTRGFGMGLAGVTCLIYALLVLWSGRPDPLPFWIPGVAGVLAAAVIWGAAGLSGPKVARATFDEGYQADAIKAERVAFWVAIWLYPVFAVPLYLGWISWPSTFAAMGTLTAATYLLGTVIFDLRGR